MRQTPASQLLTMRNRTIDAALDAFEQAQRAAKLKDWPAFRRLMDEHKALCQQWQALIS